MCSKLPLQPPSDECVWWCNTSESDGTLKCHWTFQSAPLWPCCQNTTCYCFHDVKQVSAWPESYHHLPDSAWWNERKHIMFKLWVYHCDTVLNQRNYHFSAGLTPSPTAIHSFHEVSQLSKTTSTRRGLNRSVPKAITAEMSSYRKSASFRGSGRTPSRVEGQQQSHRVEKEEWQMWTQLKHCHMLLLGRCCHVTVCQMRASIKQKTGM